MKIALLDDYQSAALGSADWSGLASKCEITSFTHHISPESAAEALRPFDIVCHLRERMPFPRSLIESLPNLKMIAITGAAHRTLDLQAARDRDIVVSGTVNRPDIVMATPELAWGLVLAVARSIPSEAARMRVGQWQSSVGMILHGKTLGLLGLGRIGRQMARYGQAFGMKVIAWSPNLTSEAALEAGAFRVERDVLFRDADVLSIHLVLGERSYRSVGAAEIGMMKQGAIFINTSRAQIVDTQALMSALNAGRIQAGLDVYDDEPLDPDSDIRAVKNAVLTPHLGYVTRETYSAFFNDTVENIEAYLSGSPIRVLN